jgi:dihydroneopterin aldolase
MDGPDSFLASQCRRLFLRGFSVQARIGAHDFERGATQRLLFDVDLYVPLSASTPQHDQLSEVVDYDFIRTEILRLVDTGHIDLQETLCDAVLQALLTHPRVQAARVATSKPDVYPDCTAVGVEVFRSKSGAGPSTS